MKLWRGCKNCGVGGWEFWFAYHESCFLGLFSIGFAFFLFFLACVCCCLADYLTPLRIRFMYLAFLGLRLICELAIPVCPSCIRLPFLLIPDLFFLSDVGGLVTDDGSPLLCRNESFTDGPTARRLRRSFLRLTTMRTIGFFGFSGVWVCTVLCCLATAAMR